MGQLRVFGIRLIMVVLAVAAFLAATLGGCFGGGHPSG
jgi:hypothetical protein